MIVRHQDHEGSESLAKSLATKRYRYDVPQDSFEITVGRLSTSEVATCIVVAAHNQLTKRGLIGHFNRVAGNLGTIEDTVTPGQRSLRSALGAIPLLGDLAATSLWLGGSAPIIVGGEIFGTREDREYAKKAAKQYNAVENLAIEWNGDANKNLAVSLESRTGFLDVESYPAEDFLLRQTREHLPPRRPL